MRRPWWQHRRTLIHRSPRSQVAAHRYRHPQSHVLAGARTRQPQRMSDVSSFAGRSIRVAARFGAQEAGCRAWHPVHADSAHKAGHGGRRVIAPEFSSRLLLFRWVRSRPWPTGPEYPVPFRLRHGAHVQCHRIGPAHFADGGPRSSERHAREAASVTQRLGQSRRGLGPAEDLRAVTAEGAGGPRTCVARTHISPRMRWPRPAATGPPQSLSRLARAPAHAGAPALSENRQHR